MVQAPHKKELEEYFTSPQSVDCNENGRLESNRENHYPHKKMLWNGKWDVIEDLEKQFNENMYFSAQEKLLQNGTKNGANEVFEVGQGSHDLLDNVLFKYEVLFITMNVIIEFKDRQTMYGRNVVE